MGSDGPARVAAVVADSSSLAALAARVDGRIGSVPATITVVCPRRSLGTRLANLLAVRGREATVREIDPFTRPSIGVAIAAADVDRVVVDRNLPFTTTEIGDRYSMDGGGPKARDSGRTSANRASTSRPGQPSERLGQPTGTPQRVALFALAFGFYLLLGEPTAFDLVTGAVSAVVVVLLLSRVTFADAPTVPRSIPRVGRALAFVPFLLWEVVRANVALAVVLLHPRLPIDPTFERLETDVGSTLELAVLANSITLTPGTLAVDARGSSLLVHTLTAASRSGLREGRLERAVRFVFAGGREGSVGSTGG